ncbi:YdcF family protein [Lysinibacillus yapensis]|uniref:YdcF family protein n=1 Tax=Ureibacillus yapensis TaxID=2304605 RepID=A0A396SSW1_9BACL|nr:YdcF family protein [Lysinibacillus yapensis]RHW39551.1 YdcF family protein [Lysinibacillus yapensis]
MNIKNFMRFVILIVFLVFIWLLFGKDFLVVNEKPKNSDVIIVLSGGSERLEKAAGLYHSGYADYVLLTNSNASGTTKEKAMALGIPENALIMEGKATSTYTNALFAKDKIDKYSFNSAIVVTSDYHIRRTKLSFDRVFKDSQMEFVYVASASNGEIGQFSNKKALREYIKLIGYILGLYKLIDLEG